MKNTRETDFFAKATQASIDHLRAKYNPSPLEVEIWLRDPATVDEMTAGTEVAAYLSRDAPAQRAGLLSRLRDTEIR